MVVEVFRTNVTEPQKAKTLISAILKQFPEYQVNFDLEDCDNILRVACAKNHIHLEAIIKIVELAGNHAIVLEDEYKVNL